MKIKSSRKLLKNETISKDASNLKCKKAVVKIKQKFLEVANLTQDIYCTGGTKPGFIKRIFLVPFTVKTTHNI